MPRSICSWAFGGFELWLFALSAILKNRSFLNSLVHAGHRSLLRLRLQKKPFEQGQIRLLHA